MRIPPTSVLASWPTPNYENPVTRGATGKIIGVTMTAFVTIILSIRLYTRLRIVRSFGLDDILIMIAFIPSFAFTVCSIYAEFNFGWDRHLWDIRFGLLVPSARLSLVTFCLFDVSSSLVKLSSLAMLFRLVRVTKSRMNIVVLLLAGLVVCSSILFIFITVFQCKPVSAYWTLSLTPQNCIDEPIHLLAAGSINTFTDFAVVFLPIKVVARLGLPRKQHIVLIGLFCAGFCACIAGCVRTYYTWIFTVEYDRSWSGWSVWVSSCIELYLGIICASVPSCKQFFTKYLPGVIDATRRSAKSTEVGSNVRSNDRNSTRMSVTVNTLVETNYQTQSTLNSMKGQPAPETVAHELSKLESPITEPPRAKLRPQTWPNTRPLSAVDEEYQPEKVTTKRCSDNRGKGTRPYMGS